MDRHTLAIVSIVGSCLDLLGALYLAYDLLGGEHGPLRAVSRGVTYGSLFAIGYGLALGPVFGIACGLTHGITLAWEYSAASRGQSHPGFGHDAAASAIRGLGHGVGSAWYFGPQFGLLFGSISTLSQIAAYAIGIRPSMHYAPSTHARFSFVQLFLVLNRTAGYGLLGWACARVVHRPELALWFGLRVGLVVGVVTLLLSSFSPMIEWGADHVPERWMGVLGIVLIFCGFTLQSVQYWVALLDVPLR